MNLSLGSQFSLLFGAHTMAILHPWRNVFPTSQKTGWSIQILGITRWFCSHYVHLIIFLWKSPFSNFVYFLFLELTYFNKSIGSGVFFCHDLPTLVCSVYCILDRGISVLDKLLQFLHWLMKLMSLPGRQKERKKISSLTFTWILPMF